MGLLQQGFKFWMDSNNQLSRGFYEAVLPAFDMYEVDHKVFIYIDLAGFSVDKIKAHIRGNILTLTASRDAIDDIQNDIIHEFRPLKIHHQIVLPFLPKDNDEDDEDLKIHDKNYIDGVLELSFTNPSKKTTIEWTQQTPSTKPEPEQTT